MKRKFNWRYYFKLILALIIQLIFAFLLITGYTIYSLTQTMLHPKRITSTGSLLKAEHIPFENITLETKDGLELAAWYVPPQNGAVILVAHGYGDKRPEMITAMLALQGYGVLAWDFRAHGESEGDISTLGYFEQLDVEAALDYALAQKGVEHIGAWGGSMGAATVILTAVKRKEIQAVVSDCSFTSFDDVLRGSIPNKSLIPFVEAFAEYQSGAHIQSINPVGEIGKISPRAVFVLDGWNGEAKEVSSPYRLYAAAREPKKIWVEEGVPHTGMYANDPQKYKELVINFFNKYLLGK